ncbi:bifunctional DNA primase/polymerase [Streptomyces sp. OF3]|uniref:Bifunctional DNA primase/polymerase n=1 Tax=Streptomyces alkaliterrae TaxID=2213162 RepID=A0A7W3WN21_9ACTN|nr:bifunctional DNA primase/polymerase [Streptomyces alkaliterrae]MBB1255407.1 bifunctional DNA primase/polymerase [Streptomyces alkaliterrae]
MREIPGRQRMTRWARRTAALTVATEWRWPVVPGAELRESGGRAAACACPRADCVVPGAHPYDPGLLAATTDARMVRWWWNSRPDAPVVLATGGQAPCALSLPAAAGAQALSSLDRLGVRVGPVVATPSRFTFLVAAYDLAELGELLYAQDHVPSSLRFHGSGGYVTLPPTVVGGGRARWERTPVVRRGTSAPWLPRTETLLDALVEATATAPGGGNRLTY